MTWGEAVTADEACVPVEATAADGARITAVRHGGQVLSWTPAGSTVDRLWTSPLANCGPGEAIRGGVPVIFPQFSTRGPLPRHGFARDRAWQLTSSAEPGAEGAADGGADGGAVLVLRLRDDAATLAVWPHRFTLTLTARARAATLELVLEVANDGGEPLTFAAALHTYLRVTDAGRARLSGFAGLPAEQNARPGERVPLPDDPLHALGPRDVAVLGTRGPVTLTDPDLGDLVVTSAGGFEDVVVWNPGAGSEPADVPRGGASQFVCVEPARLDPVRLPAGGTWHAAVTMTALPPSP